ncbi:MAG TPA: hypothetical protein VHS33_05845 [Sphingomicrobium sp.]|jgi:protein-L-isoaspartate(D-aspartate) O-methyltransferase|nr:hypothetical protein [Sphingomicrobium sp.]
MSTIAEWRDLFARLVVANVGVSRGSDVEAAFRSTPREDYLGPGPWKLFTAGGYVETPSADPRFIYQDVTVALVPERSINNGQPTLHALCLSMLAIRAGESVLHVGAGTGYYTAILAALVGSEGSVTAYEVEADLAKRAEASFADQRNVTIFGHSGSAAPLPIADVIYVNAGATEPLDVWLDALGPGGRLLFPLTPATGVGGMLLVSRSSDDAAFAARFISRAMFIPCVGARSEDTATKLTDAFRRTDWAEVRSLRRGGIPDETSWVAGSTWWLSKQQSQ